MATIICYLTDLSGYVTSFKKAIWKWLFKDKKQFQDFSLKPLDCSLCMVHHTLLLYLLASSQFTIFNYFFVCLLSFLSSNISGFLLVLKDFAAVLENKISNLIDKF